MVGRVWFREQGRTTVWDTVASGPAADPCQGSLGGIGKRMGRRRERIQVADCLEIVRCLSVETDFPTLSHTIDNLSSEIAGTKRSARR